MAEILKGAPAATAITEDLILRTQALKARSVEPCLAILRVGERVDDMSYESTALKRCEKVGIRTVCVTLPESCTQAELIAAIDGINRDSSIHGCLMFRPLPRHLDELAACDALLPEKDIDCMTPRCMAAVYSGKGKGFAPCTAQACIELLDYYGIPLSGKNIAVIGRSTVIGKPVSMLLQNRNATVTVCHTKTVDTDAICRRADILVVAAGKAGVVDGRYTNPDQIVIDVGVNAAPGGGICGDVLFDTVASKVRAISPVPGGVGSVTTAVLCKHTIEAAEASVS
ncbi:MAG: bifunctional 5,10-methylenetetrahydrofolate dehydrogenase/5,10-methenyltetrahydrofolate cyclohydrolase [Oscillospiraceae bacterium]|nr:bifunctional 5,10-methylenetetrahydrofolate dehydrogenase/5,10-methenyltetrahydrofolate cyclohydrolase [Oscillospiraceae bacterium]